MVRIASVQKITGLQTGLSPVVVMAANPAQARSLRPGAHIRVQNTTPFGQRCRWLLAILLAIITLGAMPADPFWGGILVDVRHKFCNSSLAVAVRWLGGLETNWPTMLCIISHLKSLHACEWLCWF